MSQMFLVITIRKKVADVTEGQQVYNHVKDLVPDELELEISGHVTNHFDMEDPD